jgi:hypothetical protein
MPKHKILANLAKKYIYYLIFLLNPEQRNKSTIISKAQKYNYFEGIFDELPKKLTNGQDFVNNVFKCDNPVSINDLRDLLEHHFEEDIINFFEKLDDRDLEIGDLFLHDNYWLSSPDCIGKECYEHSIDNLNSGKYFCKVYEECNNDECLKYLKIDIRNTIKAKMAQDKIDLYKTVTMDKNELENMLKVAEKTRELQELSEENRNEAINLLRQTFKCNETVEDIVEDVFYKDNKNYNCDCDSDSDDENFESAFKKMKGGGRKQKKYGLEHHDYDEAEIRNIEKYVIEKIKNMDYIGFTPKDILKSHTQNWKEEVFRGGKKMDGGGFTDADHIIVLKRNSDDNTKWNIILYPDIKEDRFDKIGPISEYGKSWIIYNYIKHDNFKPVKDLIYESVKKTIDLTNAEAKKKAEEEAAKKKAETITSDDGSVTHKPAPTTEEEARKKAAEEEEKKKKDAEEAEKKRIADVEENKNLKTVEEQAEKNNFNFLNTVSNWFFNKKPTSETTDVKTDEETIKYETINSSMVLFKTFKIGEIIDSKLKDENKELVSKLSFKEDDFKDVDVDVEVDEVDETTGVVTRKTITKVIKEVTIIEREKTMAEKALLKINELKDKSQPFVDKAKKKIEEAKKKWDEGMDNWKKMIDQAISEKMPETKTFAEFLWLGTVYNVQKMINKHIKEFITKEEREEYTQKLSTVVDKDAKLFYDPLRYGKATVERGKKMLVNAFEPQLWYARAMISISDLGSLIYTLTFLVLKNPMLLKLVLHALVKLKNRMCNSFKISTGNIIIVDKPKTLQEEIQEFVKEINIWALMLVPPCMKQFHAIVSGAQWIFLLGNSISAAIFRINLESIIIWIFSCIILASEDIAEELIQSTLLVTNIQSIIELFDFVGCLTKPYVLNISPKRYGNTIEIYDIEQVRDYSRKYFIQSDELAKSLPNYLIPKTPCDKMYFVFNTPYYAGELIGHDTQNELKVGLIKTNCRWGTDKEGTTKYLFPLRKDDNKRNQLFFRDADYSQYELYKEVKFKGKFNLESIRINYIQNYTPNSNNTERTFVLPGDDKFNNIRIEFPDEDIINKQPIFYYLPFHPNKKKPVDVPVAQEFELILSPINIGITYDKLVSSISNFEKLVMELAGTNPITCQDGVPKLELEQIKLGGMKNPICYYDKHKYRLFENKYKYRIFIENDDIIIQNMNSYISGDHFGYLASFNLYKQIYNNKEEFKSDTYKPNTYGKTLDDYIINLIIQTEIDKVYVGEFFGWDYNVFKWLKEANGIIEKVDESIKKKLLKKLENVNKIELQNEREFRENVIKDYMEEKKNVKENKVRPMCEDYLFIYTKNNTKDNLIEKLEEKLNLKNEIAAIIFKIELKTLTGEFYRVKHVSIIKSTIDATQYSYTNPKYKFITSQYGDKKEGDYSTMKTIISEINNNVHEEFFIDLSCIFNFLEYDIHSPTANKYKFPNPNFDIKNFGDNESETVRSFKTYTSGVVASEKANKKFFNYHFKDIKNKDYTYYTYFTEVILKNLKDTPKNLLEHGKNFIKDATDNAIKVVADANDRAQRKILNVGLAWGVNDIIKYLHDDYIINKQQELDDYNNEIDILTDKITIANAVIENNFDFKNIELKKMKKPLTNNKQDLMSYIGIDTYNNDIVISNNIILDNINNWNKTIKEITDKKAYTEYYINIYDKELGEFKKRKLSDIRDKLTIYEEKLREIRDIKEPLKNSKDYIQKLELRKKNENFGDFDNDNLTSAKKRLEDYESKLKIIKSLLDNNDNDLNTLIDDLIGKVERIEAKEPNSPLLFPKVQELKELKDKYKLEFDEYYKEYNKSFPGGNYLNTKLINHKYSRKFGQKLQKVNSHNITKRKMYM